MLTRQTHYAAAIAVDSESQAVLALPGKKTTLSLPQIKVTLGEDPVKELKRELEHDFKLKLRFVRSVPDTWSRLVFLHSKTNDVFTIYYIYEVLFREPKLKTELNWVNIEELNSDDFSVDDVSALDVARDYI
jgi:hypothetical protein